MGVSPYFSDDELVSNLKTAFDVTDRGRINFYSWLNTAKYTDDGIIVQVEDRFFRVHAHLGVVSEVIV